VPRFLVHHGTDFRDSNRVCWVCRVIEFVESIVFVGFTEFVEFIETRDL
jgi:hypothetical protein